MNQERPTFVARLALACAALSIVSFPAISSPNALFKNTSLPESVRVVAEQEITKPDGERFHWTTIDLDHSLSFSIARRSEIMPDGSPVLMEYEFADSNESWLYYIGQRSAVRSDRFAAIGSMAIESLFSPLALVRSLDLREATEKSNSGSDTQTYRVNDRQGREEIDLEVSTGRIVEHRRLNQAGDVISRTTFAEWRLVEGSDGSSFPWRIESELTLQPGQIQRSWFRVTEVSPSRGTSGGRLDLPQGFTVTDRIDGTTKNSQGEVIGSSDGSGAGNRATPATRFLIAACGVVVVLLAARGWYRWKAAQG